LYDLESVYGYEKGIDGCMWSGVFLCWVLKYIGERISKESKPYPQTLPAMKCFVEKSLAGYHFLFAARQRYSA
jgi:hypothetical protein